MEIVEIVSCLLLLGVFVWATRWLLPRIVPADGQADGRVGPYEPQVLEALEIQIFGKSVAELPGGQQTAALSLLEQALECHTGRTTTNTRFSVEQLRQARDHFGQCWMCRDMLAKSLSKSHDVTQRR